MNTKTNVLNSEEIEHEILSESVWWASVDNSTKDQTIFLYRKEAGQNVLLDRITIDPETMPVFEDFQFAIKELHGGGIYEATIRTPKGALARRIPFSLAGLPKKQAEPVQAAPSENGQEKLIALLIQQGQQMQQQFLAGLKEIGQAIATKPEKPEIDPFELMERAANILSKNGATPTPQKSLVEQITELKTAADLIGLGSLGGGDGGGDSWGSLAAAIVPFTEMMKENTINERLKLEMQQQQLKKQQAQQPKQVAAPVAPVNDSRTQFLAHLRGILAQVMPYVEQGADPEAVGVALVNILKSDADKATLYDFLNREDALSDMARLEPKVNDYWEWFSQLANAVLTQLEPKDEARTADTVSTNPNPPKPQATNSTGQTGDTANATNNGATGAKRKTKPVSTANSVTAS